MITQPNHATISSTEVVPLVELFRRYWRRRWLIAAITFVFLLIFTTVAFLTTPIYRAATILIPVSTNKGGLNGSLASALGSASGLASLAGINLSANDSGVEESLAVLQSRQFIEPFIVDEKVAPELFPSLWDKNLDKWRVATDKQPTPARAYLRFEKILVVVKNIKSGLVTLQIDWPDSAKAASWLNELVRRLNVEMRSRAIVSADASVGYLQKEYSSTLDVNTREAIGRLMESEIRQRMLANVTQDYALRVIDKAMPADPSDKVWPKKLVLVFVGLILGFLVGLVAAFLLEFRRKFITSNT
jgi:uncharacterized protein involved in exopolysaccharide biosynthesis